MEIVGRKDDWSTGLTDPKLHQNRNLCNQHHKVSTKIRCKWNNLEIESRLLQAFQTLTSQKIKTEYGFVLIQKKRYKIEGTREKSETFLIQSEGEHFSSVNFIP